MCLTHPSIGQPFFPSLILLLVQDRHGRYLLYELADQHRNCLLLSCAIQSIWKAGYEAEVASTSSAAAYFGVLRQLLAERMRTYISTSDDQVNPPRRSTVVLRNGSYGDSVSSSPLSVSD
jgi:hypothetical protein